MTMPQAVKKDGQTIIVDRFSGKRFPPDEEDYILGVIKLDEKEDQSSQKKKIS